MSARQDEAFVEKAVAALRSQPQLAVAGDVDLAKALAKFAKAAGRRHLSRSLAARIVERARSVLTAHSAQTPQRRNGVRGSGAHRSTAPGELLTPASRRASGTPAGGLALAPAGLGLAGVRMTQSGGRSVQSPLEAPDSLWSTLMRMYTRLCDAAEAASRGICLASDARSCLSLVRLYLNTAAAVDDSDAAAAQRVARTCVYFCASRGHKSRALDALRSAAFHKDPSVEDLHNALMSFVDEFDGGATADSGRSSTAPA